MAKRISELPAASTVVDADELELNQLGTSRKATRAQIVAGLAPASHVHTLADITDAGALAAKDTVAEAEIEDAAVSTEKLADLSVSSAKVASGAVTTAKLAANAVTEAEIAVDAVGTGQLQDGAVTTAKIAGGAVTAGEIAANAVGPDQLASSAVTTAKIANAAVTMAKIASAAVDSGQLVDGAVVSVKIASNAVTPGKIAANAVGSTELADGAVTEPKIASGAVSAAKIEAKAVGPGQLEDTIVTPGIYTVATIEVDQQGRITAASSGTAGETNTGSNVGAEGFGVFAGKVGVELQFRHIAAGSDRISVALNGQDIELDVDEGNLQIPASNVIGLAAVATDGTLAALTSLDAGGGALTNHVAPQDALNGDYTFVQTDSGREKVFTGTAAATWTIPALSAGTHAVVHNIGTAAITFAASGVTPIGLTGLAAKKTGALSWLPGNVVKLTGELSEAAPPAETTWALPEPGDWTDHGVQISRAAGTWEDGIATTSGCNGLWLGWWKGKLRLLYIGYDGDRSDGGARHRAVGMASSDDGESWTKDAGNPLITHHGTGTNNEEEGVWGFAAAVDPNTDNLVVAWGALEATGASTVRSDLSLSVKTSEAGGFSANAYSTNNIIINATGGSFSGASGSNNDEVYGFALGWNVEQARWELYYMSKEPEDWHVHHVHGADLDNLAAANSSDVASQATGAGNQEWRIGTLVRRGPNTYDLFFNRYTTAGQFAIARRPITTFPTLGALSDLYDFDAEDGTTKRGYCAIAPVPEIGKWVMAYWLTAEGTNDRTEGIRFKTAPLVAE